METERSAGTLATVTPVAKPSSKYLLMIDVIVRFMLIYVCIVAIVVMSTSKQTKMIPADDSNLPASAKFSDSPVYQYFLAALCVTVFLSMVTTKASFSFRSNPDSIPASMFVRLAALDALMLGMVAAATGTAGGVAYVELKGNSHLNWGKICNVYDKFCRYISTSIFLSLFAAALLVYLVMLDVYRLYKRIP